MCVYKIQKFCGKDCLRPVKCTFNLTQQTNIFFNQVLEHSRCQISQNEFYGRSPKTPSLITSYKTWKGKVFVLVGLTPPLFILVTEKFLKCFLSKWFLLVLNSHHPWNVVRAALVVLKENLKGWKKHINEHNNSKPLKMLFPCVVGHSGHVSEKWIFQILLL